MKGIIKSLKLTGAVLAIAMVAACGGGGGGGGASSSSTSGAAVSKGVITAKGSVFVNGIRFSTTGATIRVDDNPGVENDLKVGMIIKVRGSSDDATKTGVATLIEAHDALEGTISAIDDTNKTLTVLGQTVKIEDNVTRLNDDDTIKIFANAGFAVGQRVEVDAFPDDNGGLRATRVARLNSTDSLELKGFVNNLDADSFDLSLLPGGPITLTVNFAAGLLPAGAINGSFVEVHALLAPSAGAITASSIELEDALGAAGEKVEVEGIVTSGTVADFVINGQRVLTNASTLFIGGVAGDFALGAKLEAEGPLDASGNIVAVKISFRSNIKIQAIASGVSDTGLTLLGKSIARNGFTRIDNGPIADGDTLEVRASLDRDGNLIASRIVKRSPSDQTFLQGPVSAFNSGAGTLTILGSVLATNSQTEFRISTDSDEAAVTAAVFFANLTANVTVVKARWDNFNLITDPLKQAEIELGN